MKNTARPDRAEEFRDSGLTDRSERPTTHRLFAPMERKKQREENRLRVMKRRQKGRST